MSRLSPGAHAAVRRRSWPRIVITLIGFTSTGPRAAVIYLMIPSQANRVKTKSEEEHKSNGSVSVECHGEMWGGVRGGSRRGIGANEDGQRDSLKCHGERTG